MELKRELLLALPARPELRFDLSPIQFGMGGSPWHVTMCSMMLVRCKRNPHVIGSVLRSFRTPELMEMSDVMLQHMLQPLGLHRQRARQMQQVSRRWNTDTWSELRDLPGIGEYVAASVEVFCFGNMENAHVDHVLREYATRVDCSKVEFDSTGVS